MAESEFDPHPHIARAKQTIRSGNNVAAHFSTVRDHLRKPVDDIATLQHVTPDLKR